MKIIPPLHAWITKILGLPTRVGQLLLSNSLKTLSSWSLRPSVPNINPSSPWLSRQTNEASPWRWAGSAAKISNFCAISYKNYIHETSKNIHATCHHNFKQDGHHNYIASSLWLHPSLGWGVVYVCACAWVCVSTVSLSTSSRPKVMVWTSWTTTHNKDDYMINWPYGSQEDLNSLKKKKKKKTTHLYS